VLALPFADAAFDVVLALDLLEHIAPQDRARALSELRRVAARTLIVGCPCGVEGERADQRLADYYRRRRAPLPGWLVEHLDHGLPDARELLAAAQERDEVVVVPNASARSHERVLRWEATPIVALGALRAGDLLRGLLRRPGRPRTIAIALLALIGGRNKAPTYRQIAVITAPAAS